MKSLRRLLERNVLQRTLFFLTLLAFLIPLEIELIIRLGILEGGVYQSATLGGARHAPREKYLILGDSHIAYSESEDSFYQRLEHELSPYRVQLLNAADGGAGPLDYYINSSAFAPGFKPDKTLIFYYVQNDLTNVQYPTAGKKFLKRHLKPFLLRMRSYYFLRKKSAQFVSRLSHFRRSSTNQVDSVLLDLIDTGDVNPLFLDLAAVHPENLADNLLMRSEASQAAWAEVRRLILDTHELLRTLGSELVIIILPSTLQVNDSHAQLFQNFGFIIDKQIFTSERPQQAIRALCAEAGINCLDLLPYFRRVKKTQLYLEYDEHLNPTGRALAAKVIVRHLRNPVSRRNK